MIFSPSLAAAPNSTYFMAIQDKSIAAEAQYQVNNCCENPVGIRLDMGFACQKGGDALSCLKGLSNERRNQVQSSWNTFLNQLSPQMRNGLFWAGCNGKYYPDSLKRISCLEKAIHSDAFEKLLAKDKKDPKYKDESRMAIHQAFLDWKKSINRFLPYSFACGVTAGKIKLPPGAKVPEEVGVDAECSALGLKDPTANDPPFKPTPIDQINDKYVGEIEDKGSLTGISGIKKSSESDQQNNVIAACWDGRDAENVLSPEHQVRCGKIQNPDGGLVKFDHELVLLLAGKPNPEKYFKQLRMEALGRLFEAHRYFVGEDPQSLPAACNVDPLYKQAFERFKATPVKRPSYLSTSHLTVWAAARDIKELAGRINFFKQNAGKKIVCHGGDPFDTNTMKRFDGPLSQCKPVEIAGGSASAVKENEKEIDRLENLIGTKLEEHPHLGVRHDLSKGFHEGYENVDRIAKIPAGQVEQNKEVIDRVIGDNARREVGKSVLATMSAFCSDESKGGFSNESLLANKALTESALKQTPGYKPFQDCVAGKVEAKKKDKETGAALMGGLCFAAAFTPIVAVIGPVCAVAQIGIAKHEFDAKKGMYEKTSDCFTSGGGICGTAEQKKAYLDFQSADHELSAAVVAGAFEGVTSAGKIKGLLDRTRKLKAIDATPEIEGLARAKGKDQIEQNLKKLEEKLNKAEKSPTGRVLDSEQIAKNAKIPETVEGLARRRKEAMEYLFPGGNRAGKSLSAAARKEFEDAIIDAHKIGQGEIGKNGKPAGLGNYTAGQIKRKVARLKKAGLTSEEIGKLLDSGFVGTGMDAAELGQAISKLEPLSGSADDYATHAGPTTGTAKGEISKLPPAEVPATGVGGAQSKAPSIPGAPASGQFPPSSMAPVSKVDGPARVNLNMSIKGQELTYQVQVPAIRVKVKDPSVFGGQTALDAESVVFNIKPGQTPAKTLEGVVGPGAVLDGPGSVAQGGTQKVFLNHPKHPDKVFKVYDVEILKNAKVADAEKKVGLLIQRQKVLGRLLEEKIIPQLNDGRMGGIKVTMAKGLMDTTAEGVTIVEKIKPGHIGNTGEQWIEAQEVLKAHHFKQPLPAGAPNPEQIAAFQKQWTENMKVYNDALEGINEGLGVPLFKGGKAIALDTGNAWDKLSNIFIRVDKMGRILEVKISDFGVVPILALGGTGAGAAAAASSKSAPATKD